MNDKIEIKSKKIFEKIIDKHISNISKKKGNEIERKIYSGKIQTLKRLKTELKNLKLKDE